MRLKIRSMTANIMTKTTVITEIAAPVEVVFDVVAHVENFRKAVDHIINIEILSETTRGEGTRFRETRVMNGREATTVLEVAEYVANQRVRMVSDAGGTIWDSVFTVSPVTIGTELELVMEARPYKFLSKLMTPMIKGMIQKAIEKDMAAVKIYCEKSAQ